MFYSLANFTGWSNKIKMIVLSTIDCLSNLPKAVSKLLLYYKIKLKQILWGHLLLFTNLLVFYFRIVML